MTTHSGILAWEIPWTEKPGGLQSMGSQNSQTQLGISTTTMVLSLLSFNRGEFPWKSVLWSVLALPSLFFVTCVLPGILLARSTGHRDNCGSLNDPRPTLGEVLFRYLSKATAILPDGPKFWGLQDSECCKMCRMPFKFSHLESIPLNNSKNIQYQCSLCQ